MYKGHRTGHNNKIEMTETPTTPQGNQPQLQQFEYLEHISLHLNEHFLHLHAMKVNRISDKPFHVLWRPVDETSMQEGVQASAEASHEERFCHSCLFPVRELWQNLFPKVTDKQFRQAVHEDPHKRISAHKLVVAKKEHPQIMQMLMEINKAGSDSETFFGTKVHSIILVGLPGALRFIRRFGKDGDDQEFLECLNIEVAQWKRIVLAAAETAAESSAAAPSSGARPPSHGGTAGGDSQRRKTAPYYLRLSERSEELNQQIEDCKKFWTSTSDPRRQHDDALKEVSYNVNKEGNFLRFLGYCHRIHKSKRTPNLNLYCDYELFTDYLAWLDEQAVLAGKTCALPMSKFARAAAAVAAVKFLHWDKSHEDNFADVALVRKYRKLLKDLMYHKKANYPDLDKDQVPNWVELPELRAAWFAFETKLINTVPEKDADYCERLEYAKQFQQYVVMSLWLGMPPVRSQVLRSLVYTGNEPPTSPKDPNRIYFCDKKQTYCIWAPQQKTSKNTIRGAITLALPRATFVPILKEYLETHWPLLRSVGSANKEEQDSHLLLSCKGRAMSQQVFSQYAKGMWEQHTGKPMPAKLIRDVVVTDLGTRGQPEEVWESYGFMMSHTRRTQQAVYDKRNHTQRTQMALKDIADQLKLLPGGEEGDHAEIDFSNGEPATAEQSAAAGWSRQALAATGTPSKRANANGEPTSKALAKRQRQLKLDETWDVKQVLGRRPSSDKNEKWDVLVEWEWTWEPMSNLPLDCQHDAQQLPISQSTGRKRARAP